MSAIVSEGPGYVPDGRGGIVLLGEWGREITISCGYCCIVKQFRLCADSVLTDAECDTHLDDHLRSLGWSVGVPSLDDVCPDCTGQLG